MNHRLSENILHAARRTVAHYDNKAEDFWEGTKDHDVSQNIEALLAHIQTKAPYAILDFGCGPGRDLKTFVDLGHAPVGLEGAANFIPMAQQYSQCPVWHQDFWPWIYPRIISTGFLPTPYCFIFLIRN